MSKQDDRIINLLHNHFGFDQFRPGQKETIDSVIENENTMTVLPTGAGKSLLYQLPGYLFTGTVIIISPLISLMQDQVDRLHKQGEKAVVMLTGQVTGKERSLILNNIGHFRFVFTSPEMLANEQVQLAFRRIKISLLVVDEAHCISQWGPDFRPEYLLLRQIRQQLGIRRTLMLTATATPAVRKDILRKMGIAADNVHVIVESVDRRNIFLKVEKFISQQDKQARLLALVEKYRGPGVIYFASRKLATQLAAWLASKTNLNVVAYHAGVPPVERFKIQEQFMNNTAQVICATSAFGMGIDKTDIRFIIHYHMPGNIENYLQEIGRAGRDGKQSIAVLLYANGDETIQRQLTTINLPPIDLLEEIHQGKLNVNVLGEQAELFNFYLQHNYAPQDIVTIFKKRQQQLNHELKQMLAYLDVSDCRRGFILNYFGEQLKDRPQYCCDCDCLTEVQLPVTTPLSDKKMTKDVLPSWERRLQQLLNISEK